MRVEKSSFRGKKNRRQVFTMIDTSRLARFTFVGRNRTSEAVINMIFDNIHLRIFPE